MTVGIVFLRCSQKAFVGQNIHPEKTDILVSFNQTRLMRINRLAATLMVAR